ncbi:glycosyltransferase [Collimonas fungivorans]|nr:glycosyltransferase [Collimonas fungivorans]
MTRMPAVVAQRSILINAWGSMGDVAPFLALGQGLARSGAQVTVLTTANFGPTVISAGLAFESIGSQEACERALADPALWDPQRADALIDALFELTISQLRTSLLQAKRSGPVLFIAGTRGIRAREVLADLGLPILGVYLTPEIFRADHSSCKLGLFPPWFAQAGESDPEAMLMTGFVPVDGQPGNPDTLARLQDFLRQGPAPVTFTFGTAMKQGESLFAAARDACRQLNCRAIFLSRFEEQIPQDLDEDQFLHIDYMPLRILLPLTSALVFHGGVGTCAQALIAGCPQVVVPMAHDQMANADRVVALGVGAAVLGDDRDGPKLAIIMRKAMNDAAILDVCKRYSSVAREADGLRTAIARIESCFAEVANHVVVQGGVVPACGAVSPIK